jgi:hypothetical protein
MGQNYGVLRDFRFIIGEDLKFEKRTPQYNDKKKPNLG